MDVSLRHHILIAPAQSFIKRSSRNVYLKQSSPAKLFYFSVWKGDCFILIAKLWFHFDTNFLCLESQIVRASAHSDVAFWLFSIEQILTFMLKDAITMYYGKQHLLVLKGLFDSHMWVHVTLKAWEEVKKKLMLVGHMYIMIFIAQSYHATTKKEITVKSCPCSCFRTNLAMFMPS